MTTICHLENGVLVPWLSSGGRDPRGIRAAPGTGCIGPLSEARVLIAPGTACTPEPRGHCTHAFEPMSASFENHGLAWHAWLVCFRKNLPLPAGHASAAARSALRRKRCAVPHVVDLGIIQRDSVVAAWGRAGCSSPSRSG